MHCIQSKGMSLVSKKKGMSYRRLTQKATPSLQRQERKQGIAAGAYTPLPHPDGRTDRMTDGRTANAVRVLKSYLQL